MVHWIYVVMLVPVCVGIGASLNLVLPHTKPKPPLVCQRYHLFGCSAFADLRCGSGYCTNDCRVYCQNACLNPLTCRNCHQAIHEHAPGKCLFEPTLYEPTLPLHRRKS